MDAREKELVARHCLLNLGEIIAIWHRREWEKLAAVVEYARRGIPVEMSRTDPYMYRKLCSGLCEYHIRCLDIFDLEAINALATGSTEVESPWSAKNMGL